MDLLPPARLHAPAPAADDGPAGEHRLDARPGCCRAGLLGVRDRHDLRRVDGRAGRRQGLALPAPAHLRARHRARVRLVLRAAAVPGRVRGGHLVRRRSLVAQRTLGTAAVGAIAVANNISVYANRVDQVVTDTLYPVICSVKDRRDLLLEALLEVEPDGPAVGDAARRRASPCSRPDLVHFLLGSQLGGRDPGDPGVRPGGSREPDRLQLGRVLQGGGRHPADRRGRRRHGGRRHRPRRCR